MICLSDIVIVSAPCLTAILELSLGPIVCLLFKYCVSMIGNTVKSSNEIRTLLAISALELVSNFLGM